MGEAATGTHLFADPACKHGLLAGGLVALRRGALAVLLVGAIFYGSLIPFRFDLSRLTPSSLAEASSLDTGGLGGVLQFRETTTEDVAVNVLTYAVLAAVLFCLSRRKRTLEAIGIVALCSMLSLTAESIQSLIPQRVSSATDFVLNLIGAVLGVLGCSVLLAFRHRALDATAREFRQRPFAFCAIAISSALLAFNLLPFDFITSTGELHAAFQRMKLLDFSAQLAAITDELGGACWFALLGFLIARDDRVQGGSLFHSLRAGIRHGLILACLIECLQLFTRSHVPELTTAAIRIVGATLGAWTVTFLVVQPRNDSVTANRPTISWLLFAAAALQFFILALSLFDTTRDSQSAPTIVGWSLPFQSLWLQPAPLAGARAFSAVITACLLTATLAAALRRASLPLYRAVSSVIVICFYLGMELLSANLANKPYDVTNAFLAVLACGFALRLERWFAALDDVSARASFCPPSNRPVPSPICKQSIDSGLLPP